MTWVDFQAEKTPEATDEEAAAVPTPPSAAEAIGGEFFGGPSAAIGRAMQRGAYADSSIVDRSLSAVAGLGIASPAQEPLLPADEINSRFAPEGTKIATAPMSEGLARVIGKQKQDEIDREATWARFSNAHNWPTTFAAGTAAFMLDPLNVASMFVPGIGEESILAGLGRAGIGSGAASRIAAHAIAGASYGAAAQAPIAALKYGLGKEESSDYDFRAAFKDMAFGAAGGAVLGGGIGGLREAGALRSDAIMVPQTNHAAVRAATSQIVEGRPVDVTSVVQPSPGPLFDVGAVASRQAETQRNGYAPGIGQEDFARLKDEIYTARNTPQEAAPPTAPVPRLEPNEASTTTDTEAFQRGGYTLTPEQAAHFDRYANTPAKMRAAFNRMDVNEHIANVQSALKDVGLADVDPDMVARAAGLMRGGHEAEATSAYERAVMESVREIDHAHNIGSEGILRGTPFEDFAKQKPVLSESWPDIPFERGQADGTGAKGGSGGEGEPGRGRTVSAGPEGAERYGGQPGTAANPDAALEASLLNHPHVTTEDRASIAAANESIREAGDRVSAYAQAAGCLKGSGA